MKSLILSSLCILLLGGIRSSRAQAPEKIQIEVSLNGDDPVGNQLGYEVKEKIRTSSRYSINLGNGPRLLLLLTTMDPDLSIKEVITPGNCTAYTAVLVFRADAKDHIFALSAGSQHSYDTIYATLPFYIHDWEGMCGTNRVASVAADIMADVDKQVDFLEKNWDVYPFIKTLTTIPNSDLHH